MRQRLDHVQHRGHHPDLHRDEWRGTRRERERNREAGCDAANDWLRGNAGSYTVDQTIDIECSFDDNLSGIAVQECGTPGTSRPAYTLPLGTHTITASARDNAGNTQSAISSFTVSVTSGSLCNLVEAWVSNRGLANAMCKQLASAAYNAFQNHIRAQSGKSLPVNRAAILIELAGKL